MVTRFTSAEYVDPDAIESLIKPAIESSPTYGLNMEYRPNQFQTLRLQSGSLDAEDVCGHALRCWEIHSHVAHQLRDAPPYHTYVSMSKNAKPVNLHGYAKFRYLLYQLDNIRFSVKGRKMVIGSLFNGPHDWFLTACHEYFTVKRKIPLYMHSVGAESRNADRSDVVDVESLPKLDIKYDLVLLDGAGDETKMLKNHGLEARRLAGLQASEECTLKSISWLESNDWRYALIKVRPYFSPRVFCKFAIWLKGKFLGMVCNALAAKNECFILLGNPRHMKNSPTGDFLVTYSLFLDRWLYCFASMSRALIPDHQIFSFFRKEIDHVKRKDTNEPYKNRPVSRFVLYNLKITNARGENALVTSEAIYN